MKIQFCKQIHVQECQIGEISLFAGNAVPLYEIMKTHDT